MRQAQAHPQLEALLAWLETQRQRVSCKSGICEPLFDTALCIAGANASPPEDVGGEPGYTDFVAAMADPDHPEHHDMLEWYGALFDPTVFDISAVDLRLHKIKV